MWHKNSPPLPLAPRHPLCKCIKDVLLKHENADPILEEDCDKCNKNEVVLLRDAQTSPQKSPLSPSSAKISKKQLLSPSKADFTPPTTPSHARATLEKSNSLGESKPMKQLRTTKSLSPRPPVRHQAAITVSDENNVVVKVSPADEEENALPSETKPLIGNEKRKYNEAVENLRLDDWQKNKSTSCLVYVPSDPWTKMNHQQHIPLQDPPKGKKGSNRMKKLMDVKSLSKPDLIDDNDPWVIDESRKSSAEKSATYRHHQSKSLHLDSKSGTARPRLQRSKSPICIPQDDNQIRGPLSPKDPLSSLSPTLGYNLVPHKNASTRTNNERKKNKQQQFLNVSNPNLLQQSRHSFSTSPTSLASSKTKDDELTLNIRRLSEQIKYSSAYGSYGNFNATATSSTVTSPKTPKQSEQMEKSASLLSDSLLETTC